METTFTQSNATISQEEFKMGTDRWIEEDILKLANHFHKLQKDVRSIEQYKRVENFSMAPEGVKYFDSIKKNITKLKVYLALDEEDKRKHTFYIILGFRQGTDIEEYIKLNPDPISILGSTGAGGEKVPKIFKDMIGRNWDVLDNHLIDDLFTAEEENSTNRVRVHYYWIGAPMIEFIKKLNTIKGVTLYPGVDMNKFNNKKMISFAPTLGFKLENSKNEDLNNVFGLKGFVEMLRATEPNSQENEMYFEYLTPCPPTCVPPSSK